jgi:capsular exopolysaccharide synthesis family protein
MNEKEIHLRNYLRIIKKRRYSVCAFFLLTFAVVLIYTFTSTPIYESSTQIIVEKNESAPLMGGYYRTQYDPEFYKTQIELIKSLNVARRVVNKLSLDKTYDVYFPKTKEKNRFSETIEWLFNWPKELFANILKQSDTALNKNSSIKEKSTTDIIAKIIKSGMIISQVKGSKILNISYRSENPEFAQMIANTIATAYIEELMAIQLNTSGHAISWFTQKAEEEKTKLTKSENALQDFIKKQNIVTIEDKIALLPQKLSDYATQLSKAETERKDLETAYQQIEKLKKNNEDLETIPVLNADPLLQSLRGKIRDTERNILELSKKYGKKHPVMKRARGELKILEQKNDQEASKVIKAIKNKYELAKSKENDIRNTLDKTKKEAIILNENFIHYTTLKREVETNQALYKALTIRIREKGITDETQNGNVWITETAELPEFVVKPKKMLNILLGLILGIFGGNVLALFLEYLDNTIKEPDEVEALAGQAVIGVVPLFNPEWGKDIELASLQKPFSPFAESFKALRSSVLLSSADAPPKNLLITSMAPQEGKTTTAVNFALAIAQANYKVLLIDADMRRPRIHKIFNIQNSKGLSSYLAGAGDENIIQTITESELKIIRSCPITPLNIIPSGPIPPNPSELLVSHKLKELLENNQEKFDFIIFDSAPILGATDSLIISKITEGTIIVGRAEETTYEMINQGLKSLTDINANILGMVINGMNYKESKYHYYYGYYNQAT